jgi:hypothetical protein
MAQNLDFFTSDSKVANSPYRSKLQVEAELEATTRLTASNLNLFYASWRRLLREITRRIVVGDRSDPAIADFYRRCAERGVDSSIIKRIDFQKTTAVRAIGAGNASARTAALNDLEGLMGYFDESGKKNLIFDRTAARVGYDIARRYTSPSEEQRPTYDSKMARMENSLMRLGQPSEVSDTDMHGAHLQEHMPDIQEILAGLESGQLDGQAILPVLQLLHEHTAKHTEYASNDPANTSIAAAARELVANSNAVIMNLIRQQQKIAREGQQAGAQPAQEGQPSAKEREQELKLQEIQQRIELKRSEAESTMQRKQMEFEQKMALADVATRKMLESGKL